MESNLEAVPRAAQRRFMKNLQSPNVGCTHALCEIGCIMRRIASGLIGCPPARAGDEHG